MRVKHGRAAAIWLVCSSLLHAGVALGQVELSSDRWVEITPPQVTTGAPETCVGQGIAVDPQNPSTIYWGTTPYTLTAGGLFKSQDGGASWTRIGRIEKAYPEATDMLDMPIHVRINPNDPNHLYVGDGVRGSSMGFFVSRDGGETFERPQGFLDAVEQAEIQFADVYDVAVNPSNFDHVLLSWHYAWGDENSRWKGEAGLFESRDGGQTWIVHPPVPGAGSPGASIKFLYSPDLTVGDSWTWLFGSQTSGYHRTSDGGRTWTKVSDTDISHGGSDIYYAKSGWLYTSGFDATMRSNDNGVTWENVGINATWTVGGDGERLWTGKSFGGNEPFQVSAEDDGASWSAFNDQSFFDGPYAMAYDQYNGILYSSNWSSGVWALQANAGTGELPPITDPIPLDPPPGVGPITGGTSSGGGSASAGSSTAGGSGNASSGSSGSSNDNNVGGSLATGMTGSDAAESGCACALGQRSARTASSHALLGAGIALALLLRRRLAGRFSG